MFRKKFGHRPRSRKPLTRAQANRTFKHAVREKVINLNVKCQQICTVPGDTCPNGGKHILVSNAELFSPTATGFADAIRITRLEGVLWMKPDYSHIGDAGATCQETIGLLRVPTIFRMGLLKSNVQQALGGIPVAVNPLADGPSPFALSDAADSRFLKTWDHLFQVTDEVDCGFSTNGVIFGRTEQASYTVPAEAAGAHPAYVVPPITTTCIPCEGQVAGTLDSQRVKIPGFHPFRISYRRPIVLKENQTLDLWFGWEAMRPCSDDVPRGVQPPMITVGHVFMTVEH